MTAGVTMFAAAIMHLPCLTAVEGLWGIDQGIPSIDQMLADHADYCTVLATTGANLLNLSALPIFPDAHFVEDTALCLPEGVIFMSSGATTRLGKVASMRRDIVHLFPETHQIFPPA